MKKAYIAILTCAIPAMGLAQSAFDAQQISQSDFRGTARFMSMGGAFTALGGDLSSLNQNPAGIGIYRSNEIGVTLDINFQNSASSPFDLGLNSYKTSQTKAACNNFGYVGATNLNGALRTFNWGATFSRTASFNRVYRGSMSNIGSSLSNYIADISNGYDTNDLGFSDTNQSYDPYWDSNCDWLSILGYNSFLINPYSATSYDGLYNMGSYANALYNVVETGYLDEYNISFGGNVENLVYWGLSVGITDLNYTRSVYYGETIYDGDVIAPKTAEYTTNGDAYTDLSASKRINGTGWNLKFGVIIKPVNEFRLGIAVHTPTWYHLTESFNGSVDYDYVPVSYDADDQAIIHENEANTGYADSPVGSMDWHFKSPWKLMVGAAGVIGNKAIVSLDYQFDGYKSMSISTPYSYGTGYFAPDFQPNENLNNDIKDYFKNASTVRLGLEYRVTPQFSVRAGYNITNSHANSSISENQCGANGNYNEVVTATLDPSYTLNKNTQNLSFGLGYRYKAWYIDAAYVYTHRESTFHAFTNYGNVLAPQSTIKDNNSSLVISTGFKF